MCTVFGSQEEHYLSQRFAVTNVKDITEEEEQNFLNYTAACLEWKLSCSNGFTKMPDQTWKPNKYAGH